MTQRDPLPTRICEFLKFMRVPRSRTEIHHELGWGRDIVARWTDELISNGLLVETKERDFSKRTPALYQLAPEWGGHQPNGEEACPV